MQRICAAHSRTTGKPCKNIAGKGTDHLGEGRCRYHGGASPIKHGRYSNLRRVRLGYRIAEIASRGDLLDLDSELATLKALLEKWIERDQLLMRALESWHRAAGPAFTTLLESNDASEIRQAVVALRAAEASRPTQLPSVDTIATLIDKIGRTAERICKMSTVCTRDQIARAFEQMGRIVSEYADLETSEKIRESWSSIVVEGR